MCYSSGAPLGLHLLQSAPSLSRAPALHRPARTHVPLARSVLAHLLEAGAEAAGAAPGGAGCGALVPEHVDEVHALLTCRDVSLCALRRKYAHLFSQFAGDFSVERPHLTQPVRAQAVDDFLLQYDNSPFFFVSELMDFAVDW